jgi:hypothetical protein
LATTSTESPPMRIELMLERIDVIDGSTLNPAATNSAIEASALELPWVGLLERAITMPTAEMKQISRT